MSAMDRFNYPNGVRVLHSLARNGADEAVYVDVKFTDPMRSESYVWKDVRVSGVSPSLIAYDMRFTTVEVTKGLLVEEFDVAGLERSTFLLVDELSQTHALLHFEMTPDWLAGHLVVNRTSAEITAKNVTDTNQIVVPALDWKLWVNTAGLTLPDPNDLSDWGWPEEEQGFGITIENGDGVFYSTVWPVSNRRAYIVFVFGAGVRWSFLRLDYTGFPSTDAVQWRWRYFAPALE